MDKMRNNLTISAGLAFCPSLLLANEGGKAGLPQLDTSWYSSQIFWLLLVFGLLYFVVGKIIAPKIGGVIESRQAKIDNDLARAEQLIKLAGDEKAKAMHEASHAQQQAKEEVEAALAKTNQAIAEKDMEHDQKLQAIWQENAQKLQKLSDNFAKARADSAQDLAGQLMAKITANSNNAGKGAFNG